MAVTVGAVTIMIHDRIQRLREGRGFPRQGRTCHTRDRARALLTARV